MRHLVPTILCIVLACGACAQSSNVSGERRNVGSVTVTFTVVPSKAKPGQSVRLTLRLMNDSGRATALTFPTSQKYDFWITDGAREVWRWSSGKMFTQDVTKLEIGGQTGTAFSESWTSNTPGTLQAHGVLNARTYQGEMKATLVVG